MAKDKQEKAQGKETADNNRRIKEEAEAQAQKYAKARSQAKVDVRNQKTATEKAEAAASLWHDRRVAAEAAAAKAE